MPKVSVLIPVYNTEQFVGQAIESVLGQTFADFELVIVDDASNDNTHSICEIYAKADNRIRLYRNPTNLGMMPNWNYGLSLCSGEYWGKLDADDWWDLNFVAKCVKVLGSYKDVGMVCARYRLVDESGRFLSKFADELPDFAKNKVFSLVPIVQSEGIHFLRYNVCRQGLGLFRRSLFFDLGNYLLIQPADTEMHFRCGAYSMVFGLDEIMHYHRVWSQNDTRATVLNSFGKAEENIYLVRKKILQHYVTGNYISKSRFVLNLLSNRFEYEKFLVYKYKMEKRSLLVLVHLFKACIVSPFSFFRHYLSRYFVRKNA